MSSSCVAAFPLTVLSTPESSTSGPAPHLEAPIDPVWLTWSARLERLLESACSELDARGRRACRLTVSLRLEDGRVQKRVLALPRATATAAEMKPTALGLLRLLLAEHPEAVRAVAVRLGELVEGAQAPISFERYLNRKRAADKAQQRREALARVAGLVASIGCLGGLFGLR